MATSNLMLPITHIIVCRNRGDLNNVHYTDDIVPVRPEEQVVAITSMALEKFMQSKWRDELCKGSHDLCEISEGPEKYAELCTLR